jgi:lipoprotein-anchoring transpeptidase ErfK/SrfK
MRGRSSQTYPGVLATILLSLLQSPSHAQLAPWAEDAFGEPRSWRNERPYRSFDAGKERQPQQQTPRAEPSLQDGGARPVIAPKAPPVVAFAYDFPVASVVIDTSARKLYYVLGGERAYAYAISVGREGFNWTGTEKISRKQEWPDWHPPEEMRQRDPKLPEKMTGGIRNPLGAMALYLGNTLYRIHGTNDVKSIGQAQSSGCFRMMNSAVLHLAGLVDIGTTVTVVSSLPRAQEVSRAPEPPAATPDQQARPSADQQERPSAGQQQHPSSLPSARAEAGPEASALSAAPRSAEDYRALREYMMGR